MRKLSFQWPIYLSLIVLASPIMYVCISVFTLIFNLDKLAQKVLGSIPFLLIIWLVYGIACFCASPLRDTSAEQPKDDSNKLQVNCPKCGRLLKGATREMIGDIGVCPKCKVEFVIEQEQ